MCGAGVPTEEQEDDEDPIMPVYWAACIFFVCVLLLLGSVVYLFYICREGRREERSFKKLKKWKEKQIDKANDAHMLVGKQLCDVFGTETTEDGEGDTVEEILDD